MAANNMLSTPIPTDDNTMEHETLSTITASVKKMPLNEPMNDKPTFATVVLSLLNVGRSLYANGIPDLKYFRASYNDRTNTYYITGHFFV